MEHLRSVIKDERSSRKHREHKTSLWTYHSLHCKILSQIGVCKHGLGHHHRGPWEGLPSGEITFKGMLTKKTTFPLWPLEISWQLVSLKKKKKRSAKHLHLIDEPKTRTVRCNYAVSRAAVSVFPLWKAQTRCCTSSAFRIDSEENVPLITCIQLYCPVLHGQWTIRHVQIFLQPEFSAYQGNWKHLEPNSTFHLAPTAAAKQ